MIRMEKSSQIQFLQKNNYFHENVNSTNCSIKKLLCADVDTDVIAPVERSARQGFTCQIRNEKVIDPINLSFCFPMKSFPPKPSVIFTP